MNIEVTSVSRIEESLATAAAAVAVVTSDSIRRSGARSVPEALRGVPGLNVAQQSANGWAVTARGFGSINSEKLLVLSDTRSIYTPLFSGVFWDVQDYLLQDVERIEVIRGPGAALWGSNAVNGVINITTKTAKDTQGVYLEAGGGTKQRAMFAARHGGKVSDDAYYRVFAKYSDQDSTFLAAGNSRDNSHLVHLGFRTDWEARDTDSMTVQGDVYDGNIGRVSPSVEVIGRPGPTGPLRVQVSGGNVLGRWQRRLAEDSNVELRAYYDRTRRDDPSFLDKLDTFDLDVQHRFVLPGRQDVLWGVSYQAQFNDSEGKGTFALDSPSSDDRRVSAFFQDQFFVVDSLHVTLGTKLEHNEFSGVEAQPSVRAAWDLSLAQTIWGAISRAARVPTRLERDIAVDLSNPAGNPVLRLIGNKDFDSERLTAYELGYRWRALENLSVDLAAYQNRYSGLATLELGDPFIDPRDGRTVFPVTNENAADGRAIGIEALVAYAPLAGWQLSASYSNVSLRFEPNGLDLNRGRFLAGATPRNQFGLRSAVDLGAGFQVDMLFRHLTKIRSLPSILDGQGIPGYSEVDLYLSWQGTKGLSVSIAGQSLLHRRHVEFGAPRQRGEIERSVYGVLRWSY